MGVGRWQVAGMWQGRRWQIGGVWQGGGESGRFNLGMVHWSRLCVSRFKVGSIPLKPPASVALLCCVPCLG